MTTDAADLLMQLSDAVAALAAKPPATLVTIRAARSGSRAGILWRPDVVVTSEQGFPETDDAEILLADGTTVPAHTAGRDPGTNVAVLRLERPIAADLPAKTEPRLGSFVFAFGLGAGDGAGIRMGIVRALGPEWHSSVGGRIDRRIVLDFALTRNEEGGPVIDAAGGLLGMSTIGPRGRALVIPAMTIDRILAPLLAAGRIERGWLGVALHPVALPDEAATQTGQDRGLMVMQVSAAGPAAKAGVLVGDILVAVGNAPARRPGAIAQVLGPESVGQAIELRLVRAGALVAVSATVTARPAA